MRLLTSAFVLFHLAVLSSIIVLSKCKYYGQFPAKFRWGLWNVNTHLCAKILWVSITMSCESSSLSLLPFKNIVILIDAEFISRSILSTNMLPLCYDFYFSIASLYSWNSVGGPDDISLIENLFLFTTSLLH